MAVQPKPSEMGPTMQGNWRPWVFRPEPEGPEQDARPDHFIGPYQDFGPILDFGQD